MRRLGLLALVLLIGCAPASEVASLRLFVDGDGALVGVYAGTSAAGVEVELDLAMQLENFGGQPCAVAIYRWTDALPDSAALPDGAQAWPDDWSGGERIDAGVVEPGATLLLEPDAFAPAEQVEALFGVAVCPDAELELDVRAEVSADLGVRAIAEALSVELWRAD